MTDDMGQDGQDLYIRLAASEIGLTRKNRAMDCDERENEEMELPLFNFGTIANATNKFSIENLLGRGGFGSVYKGTLAEGQHIAVKRLNILLDNAMNPKISDFGLAKTFWGDQTEANTNKVVGTYGYMSPEYAIDGVFSMKSDVFSFGVLVLEIVSGKKNRGFSHPDHDHNLLGHAWRLWTERRPMELIDETLRDFCLPSEVQRCIHVGLLCVQQRPEDRPNMSFVIVMLGSESALPQPKQPGFFTGRNLPEAESSTSNCKLSSANECTVTLLEPRYQRGGSGCPLLFSDLIDMRDVEQNGQDLYIRLAASEIEDESDLNSDEMVDEISMRGTRCLDDIYARCHLAFIEPSSYAEAFTDEHRKQDIKVEMIMIRINKTWLLVDKPKDNNVIGVKWIFRTKLNPNGSVNKYKARLVVKGFTHVYGVDYLETYAPVARHDTIRTATAVDTLSPSQSIKDGETLVSADGSFELGFFSPTVSSTSRFLGIWYKKVSKRTVVWVANRETAISDDKGVLLLSNHGSLSLLNSTNSTVWNENWEELSERFEWFLSSWKSTDDPAPGQYFVRINISGYPQLVIEKGSKIAYRTGSWNGLRFIGMRPNAIFSLKLEFELNENEVYYTTEVKNNSVVIRIMLNPSGFGQILLWSDKQRDWESLSTSNLDQCENYALCGTYAACNGNDSPTVCSCLEGFTPKFVGKWNSGIWYDGCVRRTPLVCNNGDSFLKRTGLKFPDTSHSKVNTTMNIKECRQLCLSDCSCTAYTNSDIRKGGSGCLLWFGDLSDMRDDMGQDGQDLYIRLAASEIANIVQKRQSWEKKRVAIIVGSVIIGMGMLMLPVLCIRWRKRNKKGLTRKNHSMDCDERENEELELPLFNFGTIANATNNFSIENLLGRGGFGSVYKGTLAEGQHIAVKRLSKNSGQGLKEFKNEVILIAKLQHRNLVKLLGCCIQGDEKLLIYEYMANKSLDYFIFDQTRSKLLDWSKRVNIIGGIARGLLYLHQDSRLRIIHRDLKSGNILLDNAMNPKISDFGLAKTFWGEQTEANTNKVVGTYGYMSPEYAIDGVFSMKSDVFGIGVLVLEIVSGKKNRGFSHPDHDHNLLGHAWKL
ncbi:S-locus lectin protein kinase family protein, putative [Theobroma cacao]|uniref:non-specific serine/threonine protein kinase n=1 Tax=Theobroma cacao TaxID=3641 RepID=A0A061F6R7_THECC|nr:S-locus lectin protein kinase family protein, putative [Theobroma cacao]